jgi:hypothetical protein
MDLQETRIMPGQNAAFEFDENGSFDANLSSFGDYIEQLEATIGLELRNQFEAIIDKTDSVEHIWERLADVCGTPPSVGDNSGDERQPTNTTSSSTIAPQTSAVPSQTVTGWLLKSVSIEGFRGINNEGRPLELKFKPGKVSSVSAVNGVGKTSVYDSLRYAITGKLVWLEELPASERGQDYYQNQFHSSGQSTIKLRLIAEPNGENCEIVVVRSENGVRTVQATQPWDAEEILTALDREFVFLDGPTFHEFISATPLNRGRTFSGLLGLSAYSDVRQALSRLANTRAFNNKFDTSSLRAKKELEMRRSLELTTAISSDFDLLVGSALDQYDQETAWTCHAYVPVSQLIYAAFRSNAKGLLPPSDEWRRRGL